MDTIAYSSVTSQRSAQDLRNEALQMIQRMRKPQPLSVETQPTVSMDTERLKSFSSTLSSAINSVNNTQQMANIAQQEYATGDGKTGLTDAVLNTQQASLEFQLLASVRNKAINAYKEVMSMNL